MKLVIICGQSGSGKTVALHLLEDLGYRTVDNLPVEFYQHFLDLETQKPDSTKLAIGVDPYATAQNIGLLLEAIEATRGRISNTTLLYLSTDRQTLLKRYNETRRRHPFATPERTIEEAIDFEASVLRPLIEHADTTLDTTHWSSHELRNTLREQFSSGSDTQSSSQLITLQSFGFKYGMPRSADFVFDVRSLPNPYWEPNLRDLTGCDAAIQQWLGNQTVVQALVEDIGSFLEKWLPSILRADRSYVTVAIGCTGGRHRSVFTTEQLKTRLAQQWPQVITRHRELDSLKSNNHS